MEILGKTKYFENKCCLNPLLRDGGVHKENIYRGQKTHPKTLGMVIKCKQWNQLSRL